MKEFQREERYIVVKIKDVGATRLGALRQFLAAKEIPTRECVVVEPDWPIYEETWENVQRLAEGRPSIGEERDALAAHVRRGKASVRAWGDGEYPDVVAAAKLAMWTQDAPTTSLARLKAQWQAEVLEDCADYLLQKGVSIGRMHVQEFAARRQAEGGE